MITGRCKIVRLFDASLTSMVSNRSSRYLNSIMSDFTRDSSMNYWLVHQKPSTKNRQITKTWKEYCLHSWYHRKYDICVIIYHISTHQHQHLMFISLLTHALSFQLSFEVSPLVSLVHLQSTVCRTSFLPGNTWCHDQSTEVYQDVLQILIVINWIWIWSDIAYDSVLIEPQNDAFEKRSFCSEMGILGVTWCPFRET